MSFPAIGLCHARISLNIIFWQNALFWMSFPGIGLCHAPKFWNWRLDEFSINRFSSCPGNWHIRVKRFGSHFGGIPGSNMVLTLLILLKSLYLYHYNLLIERHSWIQGFIRYFKVWTLDKNRIIFILDQVLSANKIRWNECEYPSNYGTRTDLL